MVRYTKGFKELRGTSPAEGRLAESFEKPWPGIGVGGALALDLVNTLDWRLRAEPVELLKSLAELARWARSAGVLDARQARGLRAWSAEHPRAAGRALAEAIEVREAIAGVFLAAARNEPLPARALGILEEACRRAWAERTLRSRGAAATWDWRDASGARGGGAAIAMRPALAAALDAARLLTSDDRAHVRQCGDAQCGWVFLDTSRNHNRRWCSMQSCGNRNKARRFDARARRRAANDGA